MTYYYHEVPGRLRVTCPSLKGKETRCQAAKAELEALPRIRTVTVKSVTGSIVVTYDPNGSSCQEIRDLLAQKGYFQPEKAVAGSRFTADAAEKAVQMVGKAMLGAVVKGILQDSPLALISVLL